jgi:hypothetical protein
MGTTLPGLTSMRTLDPMSMRIHTGIIAPIITPIDGKVRRTKPPETDILAHERLSALQGMDGDGYHLTGPHLVYHCHAWPKGKP